MGMGSAGCGYEYRVNNRGTDNGYQCPRLDKTRDGFYCREYQTHLSWKILHEFTKNLKNPTYEDLQDKTTVEVKHPIRTRKCHE